MGETNTIRDLIGALRVDLIENMTMLFIRKSGVDEAIPVATPDK